MAETAQPRIDGSGRLWRNPDFLKLWTAETISVFGSEFTLLALPLIAAITLQASPSQMGLLSALRRLPFLVLGLFVGVWIDRTHRRPVLVVSDLGRALLLATIPLAAVAGVLGMAQLYAVAFLVGVLTLFFDVAYQAYLPSLIPRQSLVEGNSKLEASRSVADTSGPALAGLVIQILTAPIAIVVDALSFLFSGLLILAIRAREELPRVVRASLLREAQGGLALVFSNPVLRPIALTSALANLFRVTADTLYILFAVRELGVSAGALGVIWSLGNIGGLVGALLAAPLAGRFGIGPVIIGAAIFAGLGYVPIVMATSETAVPLLIFGGLLITLALPIYNVNQLSLRQAITATHLQGRMNATMRVIVWGTLPLGALLGGAIGEVIGLRPAIALATVAGFTSFLWVLFSPVRRLRTVPLVPQVA